MGWTYIPGVSEEELYHHGILGQKWGVRRFQNKDGSLTSAGKKRYNTEDKRDEDETFEAKKQRIIASADSKELREFASNLSLDEYRAAVQRVELDQRLRTMEQMQKDAKWRNVDQWIDRANKTTSTLTSIYDITATLNNAFNPNLTLPKFDAEADLNLEKKELEIKKLKNEVAKGRVEYLNKKDLRAQGVYK
jgi:hypothetical protein